ncbi:hypothetical protein [Kosakonia cowanii]|uniref:hypothetical protein n=1 Tax=Kosakonia cowanii TaxID=208223 RepID=UPI001CEF77B9|nr:hypothetical protein [Kosakonia cowanii]
MSFNNKKLLITLLSLCTFQTYATQCTTETFAKNQLNNFILLNEPTRTEVPKSVSITIDSPDGYLRTSVQSNFSQCGELISGHMKEVKTSTSQNGVFTATSDIQLNKTESGWRIKVDSTGVIADKNSQKIKQIYRQTLEGMYLLNDKGILSRAVNRSVIAATKPENKDKTAFSTIDYAFNSLGLLASATSKGSMPIDNYTIVYSYDSNHRLIKTQSPSTVEELSYDNEGRELTLSKTQTYFTIEKN